MSVIMILRVPGNPADFEKYAAGPGGVVLRRVGEASKTAGGIRHMFAGGDNEIVVIDEWPDEAAFHAFFASQPEIPDIMRDGGAKGAPEVTFYRPLDTPDQY